MAVSTPSSSVNVSAAMIKQLRIQTGAGMMDCKHALSETGGDLDAAVEALRKKGVASAEKKAARIAAEGVIATAGNEHAGVLVEINCETDFVAKDAAFQVYAAKVAAAILASAPQDLTAVAELILEDGDSVETTRRELIARIGENISIRRFALMDASSGALGVYLHGTRIGVMVRLSGGDAQLGRDIAMHIAASRPLCIGEKDMSAEVLKQEKSIFMAQAEESGKPPAIAEKMVVGRMKKFLKENTLLGQPFVKDPERSVAQLVADASASVEQMIRFEVGEGLEKRDDDFVAEVMAQAGSQPIPINTPN